jgi:hypothetical protein
MKISIRLGLLITSVIVIAGLIFLYFFPLVNLFGQKTANNMLQATFYRGSKAVATGGTEFTTIGAQTGITGVAFVVVVKNTGNINLVTYIDTITPSGTSFATSFDTNRYVLIPNQTMNFTTPILPTIPFESLSQPTTFFVRVRQDFSCPLGNKCVETNGTSVGPGQNDTLYLTGSLSYNMQPDVVGVSSTITFTGANSSTPSVNATNTTTPPVNNTTSTTPSTVTLFNQNGCNQNVIYCPLTGYSSCSYVISSVSTGSTIGTNTCQMTGATFAGSGILSPGQYMCNDASHGWTSSINCLLTGTTCSNTTYSIPSSTPDLSVSCPTGASCPIYMTCNSNSYLEYSTNGGTSYSTFSGSPYGYAQETMPAGATWNLICFSSIRYAGTVVVCK